MTRSDNDVLIIGGGVAGLTLALELAGQRGVTLLRPARDERGASRWAQGGIAAVLDPRDTNEAHVRDTLIAGDGLCDEAAVRFTVEQGRRAIDWLVSLGVPFTPAPSPDAPYPFHLTREGGHGARRIIHAADATGKAVVDTLLARVQAHAGIHLIENLHAIELLKDAQGGCCGALCLDEAQRPHFALAHDIVLATGGASGLYLHTTSPTPACGEGMAMAAALGATLMNLEFQQFHPTCLYDPSGAPFLISEAVRGEGGLLCTIDGHRFMAEHDPRAELAPRDIVARAIHAEMLRSGADHVLLDVTHLDTRHVRGHFPTIHAHCLSRGLDITRQPIPVVPAAHYSCGGVATGLDGATDVPHLYAIGEVACTGLHGANRMASNSLLECLVFARSAARALCLGGTSSRRTPAGTRSFNDSVSTIPDQAIQPLMQGLQRIMSDHVGIVRSDDGLQAGRQALQAWAAAASLLHQAHAPTPALARLRHALVLADLTLEAALGRRESRGLHYNRDCARPHAEPGTPSRLSLRGRPDKYTPQGLTL
ncbi:MAG: L-aspartate oxidase [Halomonas sp.]|nr:L-aspartate oxidase [Halomonas sp.]